MFVCVITFLVWKYCTRFFKYRLCGPWARLGLLPTVLGKFGYKESSGY